MSETTQPLYAVMKDGLYYGPRGIGFTGLKAAAGCFTKAGADQMFPPDGKTGVRVVLWEHAPEFAPNCPLYVKEVEIMLSEARSKEEETETISWSKRHDPDEWAEPLPPVGSLARASGQMWRHHNTGRLYHIIAFGVQEDSCIPLVIYQDASGTNWTRPCKDFFDGRFIQVILDNE